MFDALIQPNTHRPTESIFSRLSPFLTRSDDLGLIRQIVLAEKAHPQGVSLEPPSILVKLVRLPYTVGLYGQWPEVDAVVQQVVDAHAGELPVPWILKLVAPDPHRLLPLALKLCLAKALQNDPTQLKDKALLGLCHTLEITHKDLSEKALSKVSGLTRAEKTFASVLGARLEKGLSLRGESLAGEDYSGSKLLMGADLRGADLTGTQLRLTDLTRANLREANLTGADMRHTCLWDAQLAGATLTGAMMQEATYNPLKPDFPNGVVPKGVASQAYRAFDRQFPSYLSAELVTELANGLLSIGRAHLDPEHPDPYHLYLAGQSGDNPLALGSAGTLPDVSIPA